MSHRFMTPQAVASVCSGSPHAVVSSVSGRKRIAIRAFGCESDHAADGRCESDRTADGRCESDRAAEGMRRRLVQGLAFRRIRA